MKEQHQKLVLFSIGLGNFMSTLDTGIVNTSLPEMSRHFHTDFSLMKWIITAYVGMITICLIPAGKMADRWGRKRVYLWGLFLFALTSALCGLSSDPYSLILGRALQGMAAACLIANSNALVAETLGTKTLGKNLGLISILVAVGFLTGPALGGLITTYFHWSMIFYLNLPISIFAILLVSRLVPSTRTVRAETPVLSEEVTIFNPEVKR